MSQTTDTVKSVEESSHPMRDTAPLNVRRKPLKRENPWRGLGKYG